MHLLQGRIGRKIRIGFVLASFFFLCVLTGILCYSSSAGDDIVILSLIHI